MPLTLTARMGRAQAVVTGASGFVGRWLVRELCGQGLAVRALVRDPAAARNLFPPSVEIAAADVASDDLAPFIPAGATLYHAAGAYRFGLGHSRGLHQANVLGTRRVLDAAARARPAVVVHISTAGLLRGCGTLNRAADFPPRPPALCPYKRTKWLAERLALDAAAQGLPVVIASPTCPVGPEDATPTPTGAIIRDFLLHQFPCSSRTALNFLHVRDLAAGLVAAATRGVPGRRYLLGGANLWLDDFLRLVSRHSRIPAPNVVLPWPLIAAAGVVGEIGHFLHPRASRRVCVESAIQARKRRFFDVESSQIALAWRPARTVDDAVAEAVAWFRAHSPQISTPRGAVPQPHAA